MKVLCETRQSTAQFPRRLTVDAAQSAWASHICGYAVAK